MKKEYVIDTDTCTESEEQLRFLMMENEIFINNGWWYKEDGKPWPEDHITIHVICNDVFAWGCSDSEDLLYGEIKDLFDHYIKDSRWGTAIWCIKKRKIPPKKPVYDMIKNEGVWPIDEILKSFEEN